MARKPNPDAELFTASLPRIPVKPSQLNALKNDAASRGLGNKFAAYVRAKLLSKLAEPDKGMPVDEVMRNLADIGRARQYSRGNPALDEILDTLTKRHMNVIKP